MPSRGAPRYATDYIVRGLDGRDYTYVAGCTDASLQRSMPVGTHIRKERWRLGYEQDGNWVNFPMVFYSVVLGIALACMFWGILEEWRNRMNSN